MSLVLDYVDGQDQIFAQFDTCLPDIALILPGGIDVQYQGVTPDKKQEEDKFWCRVALQTGLEQQTGFRADWEGQGQKRRYTTDGLVFVQLFIPKMKQSDFRLGQRIAVIMKNAFRGKQTDGCIWFRNTRTQDSLPEQDGFKRLNVVSEYTYDEIG